MKKQICMLLVFLLLPVLCGCTATPDMDEPVSFYYPKTTITYHSSDDVIAPETRESAPFHSDPVGLFQLYLNGPISTALENPFPEGVLVRSYTVLGNEVILELSGHFGSLTGIQQTLASASIARTLYDLSGAQKATIIIEGITQPQVIYYSDMLFLDEPAETTPPKE